MSPRQQTVLEKIRARGHWRVVIRPTTFEGSHIPSYSDLFPIVEKNAVRIRGWGYPHDRPQESTAKGGRLGRAGNGVGLFY